MKTDVANAGVVSLQVIATAVQTDEILQYISIGLTILSVIIIIILNLARLYKETKGGASFWTACKKLFLKLFSWFKKAKNDDKITSEEIEDLKNEVEDEFKEKGEE